MAEGTALGMAPLTPGSAVGRLGEDAATAEAAAAAAAASRDTRTPEQIAAEAAASETPEQTPEQKAADEAAKAQAITDAEKAVTEAKTPEEKAAAEAKLRELKGEPAKKDGAPEKYEDFKLPDGVEIDKTQLESFLPLAKELNLSQDQAQKLIDFQAGNVKAAAEKQVADWNKLLETRLSEAKADKEIGGANFEQTVADARVFLKQFGTPALQEYLNTAEAASHVEVIRAFAKAGRALADDKFVPASGGGAAQPKSLAERLFPTHKS